MTIQTAPADQACGPGTDDPAVVHGLCILCFPDPGPGDRAVCGHVGKKGVIPKSINCVVCLDIMPAHQEAHRRETFERMVFG